jgi:hypothetical protein
MLHTSSMEGFCVSIAESKSYGIPCVLYELPYMELTREDQGSVSVPQEDVSGAADAVIRLLLNDEERVQMGREARESIMPYARFDTAAAWREVLDGTMEEYASEADVPYDPSLRLLLKTITDHYRIGTEIVAQDMEAQKQATQERIKRERNTAAQKAEAARKKTEGQLKRMRGEYKAILTSRSFRIGRAITYVPRKAKALVRHLRILGVKKALRVIRDKLRRK